jgi:hypothetical protein
LEKSARLGFFFFLCPPLLLVGLKNRLGYLSPR